MKQMTTILGLLLISFAVPVNTAHAQLCLEGKMNSLVPYVAEDHDVFGEYDFKLALPTRTSNGMLETTLKNGQISYKRFAGDPRKGNGPYHRTDAWDGKTETLIFTIGESLGDGTFELSSSYVELAQGSSVLSGHGPHTSYMRAQSNDGNVVIEFEQTGLATPSLRFLKFYETRNPQTEVTLFDIRPCGTK